jgi:large subunit ribosomal protein L2
MALKTFNPTTPSQRQLVIVDRSALYKGKPVKALTVGLSKSGGRNNLGRITARFIGGGHKRTYRIIDFKRRKFDVEGTVARIEYDPNRTAFIALISYADGEQAYIIAPQRLAPGDKVIASEKAVDVKPGNAMPLQYIPVGSIIHNVEMKPGKGGQIARSAGSYAQLVGRDQGMAILRLNSGEQRLVPGSCLASIGAVSNPDHGNINDGKAGRTAVVKAALRVVAILFLRGASLPRASAHGPTRRPTSSLCARAISARSKRGSLKWLVQYGKVRLLTAIFSRRLRRFVKADVTK